MWAQLIKVRLRLGPIWRPWPDVLKAAEQPGSGLLRELFMYDQHDPDSAYILAVFESEEKAREREQDPRRAEGQQAIQEMMATMLAAPPEFTNLTVTADWVPQPAASSRGPTHPRTPDTVLRVIRPSRRSRPTSGVPSTTSPIAHSRTMVPAAARP
jgi:hypothetical protein